MPSSDELPRLIPTGTCWCGCRKQVGLGSFFAQGHDKMAEAALIAVQHGGSVAQLLHANGFGPGRSVRDEAVARGLWVKCPNGCGYAGTEQSVANHKRKYHKGD